jgi:4-diphosphocytidyl-2-C-methyl-D-erythritol kinase
MGKVFNLMQGITLFSPAKVNLFFKILGKRTDGYHEVASLNQAINLGDEITLARSLQDTFTCSDPNIPLDHTNLVLKALTLFREKTAFNFPVSIHLEKKIPIQAGLGGGSSNPLWTTTSLRIRSGYENPSKMGFFFRG